MIPVHLWSVGQGHSDVQQFGLVETFRPIFIWILNVLHRFFKFVTDCKHNYSVASSQAKDTKVVPLAAHLFKNRSSH